MINQGDKPAAERCMEPASWGMSEARPRRGPQAEGDPALSPLHANDAWLMGRSSRNTVCSFSLCRPSTCRPRARSEGRRCMVSGTSQQIDNKTNQMLHVVLLPMTTQACSSGATGDRQA